MDTYNYIGGDNGVHYNVWNSLYKNEEIPDHMDICFECGVRIFDNCFIENSKGERRVIGECCVSKFPLKGAQKTLNHLENQGYQVTQMNSSSSSGSSNYALNGNQGALSNTIFRFNPETHFDEGKYLGHSFESVFKNDPGYLMYVASNPCNTQAFRNAFEFWEENKSRVEQFFEHGKYKGRTFESVLSENPGYYRWLLVNKTTDPDFQGAIVWYQERSKPREGVFSFGKHTGKRYEDVLKEAPGYFQWLKMNCKDGGDEIRKALEWYENTEESANYQKAPEQNLSPDTFTFGKHKGKTIEAIWEEDPKYFFYVIRRCDPPNSKRSGATFTRLVAEFQLEKLGRGNGRFESGKYKNRTYEEVKQENESYFTWIRDGYKGNGVEFIRAYTWYIMN